MSRTSAVIGTALFFFIAPCVVAGLIPWSITRWELWAALPLYPLLAIAGGIVVLAGLLLLLDSFVRFAVEGIGTPAPVAPTRNLVIRGGYRFVRNPMYVAVVSLILGQALMFASLPLLFYGAAIWLAFHLFVLFYEEPTLESSFGEQYASFRAEVPRWIPRIRPVAARR
jgi:protein-S-isoprenylcysteine O-methyltransferase Ste14